MPGKTSIGNKKQDLAKDRPSADSASGYKKVSIWPEWSEAAIATEKFDLGFPLGGANTAGGGKGKERKGIQPSVIQFYEDIEKTLLPSSLADPSAIVWKRPFDLLVTDAFNKTIPIVVADPESTDLDLLTSNGHLFHSQLMCWVIGQVIGVWQMRHCISTDVAEGTGEGDKETAPWCPWGHIQPQPKGMNYPLMNPAGKYYVRLFWMGCWRKITVDDKLPFYDKSISDICGVDTLLGKYEVPEGEVTLIPLYPRTENVAELWPALIFKAILKVVALDYIGGKPDSYEYGDSSVVHMLTRWSFHTVQTDPEATWEILKDHLPMWVREIETTESQEGGTEENEEEKKSSIEGEGSKEKKMDETEDKATGPKKDYVLLGCVNYSQFHHPGVKATRLKSDDNRRSSACDHHIKLCIPALLTQVRDQTIEPPPKEPPLPILQAPYYLGLTKRMPSPSQPDTPPTPPPQEPRFIEVIPSVFNPQFRTSLGMPNKAAAGRRSTVTSVGDEPIEPSITNHKKWHDYLDFCSTFKSIQIFKNPKQLNFKETHYNLTRTIDNTPAQIPSGTKKSIVTTLKTLLPIASEDDFLFIDSVKPVDLLFVFSSLSNWRENNKNTHLYTPLVYTSSSSTPTNLMSAAITCRVTTPSFSSPDQQTQQYAIEQRVGAVIDHGSDSSLDTEGSKKKCILPGRLVVQTHSWRTVQFGDPVLYISTTGTKGKVLMLPPGRHVLKLHAEAPIGHYLEILSDTQFIMANEDSLFDLLSQECCRSLVYSKQLVGHLLSGAGHVKDLEMQLQPLVKICEESCLNSDHAKVFLAAALHTWSTHAKELSSKEQIVWKAYLQKVAFILEKKLPQRSSPVEYDVSKLRQALKIQPAVSGSNSKSVPTPESWVNREPTSEESLAAHTISKSMKQHTKAILESYMSPESEVNETAISLLQGSLPFLEPLKEKLGTTLLLGLMKLDPFLVEKLPFANDLSAKAHSTVYTGSFPSIAPNSWTITLRKRFHISEPQFIAFQYHCPLHSNLLRVIDNDAMLEVPRVIHLTVPSVFYPNRSGYTIQAEAWATDTSTEDESEDKKWKLRVITSNKDCPPVLEGCDGEEGREIQETFKKQDIMDYCLPNREEVIFRYLMITTEECQVSIQVSISKQDAMLNLEIYDNNEVLTATEGRGSCTIPLWVLCPTIGNSDGETHKYVVQGTILRKSWPTTDTAWPHIGVIKSADRASEESSSTGLKPMSGKKSKMRERRKSNVTAILSTQSIDLNKPHWVIHIVTKESEGLLVRKDTEKEDKLKSMLQAWEAEQPGRTKRAQKSRQKFLEGRALCRRSGGRVEEEGEGASHKREIPRPNTGPVKIWQMDLTPFTVKAEGNESPKLLDETEQARQSEDRQKLFKEYRINRQSMLQVRNDDRERRNKAKVKQLEMVEEWQVELTNLRNKLNATREGIREKHLALEKARAEKEAEIQKEEQLSAGGRESKVSKGRAKKKK